MVKLPQNVVQFASQTRTDLRLYDKFKDYFCHYMSEVHNQKIGPYESGKSFMEKEAQMNKVLLSEIQRISQVQITDDLSLAMLSTNPMFQWASMAIVSSMIDTILPLTIIDSIGLYTEMKQVDFGNSWDIDIAPRSLFSVSEAGNGQRQTWVQTQYKTTHSLVAKNHQVTVGVDLYRVLAGLESLAEFTRKAVISAQTLMTTDAYGTFREGLQAATVPNELKVVGYSQSELLRLCQTVTAYNQGAKAVIVGTAGALQHVLPDVAAGNRIVSDVNNISIQLIRTFIDYDILVLPQVATGDFSDYSLALHDDEIYIIAPSSDKIVKGVIEGQTLTNVDGTYANANLTQNATLNMRWNFGVHTNATAASMSVV